MSGETAGRRSTEADREAALEANRALYEALENGDQEAVEDAWLGAGEADDKGGVVCVHPGWPVLRGRAQVTRSYMLIMANTEYIQFILTDEEAEVQGDVALVTCTENILSGGEAEEEGELGPLVGGKVVSTNLFRRTPAGWKLWSHHGSPVLTSADEDDED
ncbi:MULTISPECIES: nuclear transport factor 2 family protein [unclassified Streptomyces]|uniref:nuclear transport factor 2 family protein n=1 Tax=unclassified Streptomyces TaxID=2593676 RepID=UPI0005F97704|nr:MULTISPECIES: nuclear transport factor 2 family protein [unclassified Streptomyces]KJY37643.1 3-dehydroquinate dehydratase [Streptomyces sp. NRRL S-495]KOV13497.1 3-dehydroquinate dehydratase [Streptomyces sp. XY431]WTA52549.1 nuclear transport factor 2 family protein [Kitasatospora purpeofusca]